MFPDLLNDKKFVRDLDDAFYAEFPEEWEQGELFLDLPIFYSIWKGEADRHVRPRQDGEKVTPTYLLRAGRKVWEVGRVYTVRAESATELRVKTDQNSKGVFTDTYSLESKGTVVGYLKLVEIKPDNERIGQKEDELIFEKVDNPS